MRPIILRDDSSSDSEELSANTPLLVAVSNSGIGLTVPHISTTVPHISTTVPTGSNVREFDTMFSGQDSAEVPLGGTAQTVINEP